MRGGDEEMVEISKPSDVAKRLRMRSAVSMWEGQLSARRRWQISIRGDAEITGRPVRG